jgi:hypothetical protein
MSPAASLLSGLYFAPPSKPAALYAGRWGRFGGLRCFSQGFASAIVAYSGASATAAPGAAPVAADFLSIDALTLALLEGRLTGPAQIIGAVALFLTAHHATPRLLGLLTGLTAVWFHMQGVTLQDALVLASEGLRRAVGVLQATHQTAAAP